MKKKKIITATIIGATAALVASAIVPAASASFTDVNETHEFAPHIKEAVKSGLVKGYGDGTFGINNNLKRGQAVIIIGRYLEKLGYTSESTKSPWLDVKDEEVIKYGNIVKDAGVFNGYADDTLKGNEFITREHMAVVLDRLAETVTGTSLSEVAEEIEDVEIADLATANADYQDSIQALRDLEISTADNFNPKGNVKRGQFAKFIVNTVGVIDGIESAPDNLPSPPNYDVEDDMGVITPSKPNYDVEDDMQVTPENIPSLDGSAEDNMGVVSSAELTDKDLTDGRLVVSGHVFEDLHINVSEGAEITLENTEIKGELVINGSGYSVEVKDSNVARNGVLINQITISEDSENIELTINQNVNAVNNNGSESIIKVNSNVEALNSNGTNTSIYIKEEATVKNAVINGDSERVVNNGTLENTTVSDSSIVLEKEENVKIESVNPGKQGTITFTLNEATSEPLTLDDISIICQGGKSMTVVNITTDDNKHYTLSTAYYKDSTYDLYLTLPNGKVVSKEFEYSYNHPTAAKAEINRVGESEATLDIYGVDEGGYLYYTLVEKTRNSITKEYLKENGTKVNLVAGYNEVKITALDPNKQYEVYYMMEAFDGRVSPVHDGLTIGEYIAPEADEYIVESIFENVSNTIVFNFNRPVEGLTLEDFDIKCPLGTTLTTTNATLTPSNGGKTWTMVIPQNYQHADNKYTATIKMPDGNYIQGTFTSHFNYPVINGTLMTRPSEDKLKFEFNSDEHGTVYYGVYEWNGEYNSKSNNPLVDDVLNGRVEGTHQKDLAAGSNTLEVDLTGMTVTSDTRLWVLYVDYAGNYRTGWTDYYKVPTYVPPVVEPEAPEVESTLEITATEVYEGWTGLGIDLTFNEELGASIAQNDIKLESLSGVALPARLSTSIWTLSPTVTSIEFMNVPFQAGEYRITVQVTDMKGNKVEIAQEFTVH